MTRVQVLAALEQDAVARRLLAAHGDAFNAFCACMEPFTYGVEETESAWHFFLQGWLAFNDS
jgi:hypothetical protein